MKVCRTQWEDRGAEGDEGGGVWGGGAPLPTGGGVWGGGCAPSRKCFGFLTSKWWVFAHSW